jgi:hypothetical protein
MPLFFVFLSSALMLNAVAGVSLDGYVHRSATPPPALTTEILSDPHSDISVPWFSGIIHLGNTSLEKVSFKAGKISAKMVEELREYRALELCRYMGFNHVANYSIVPYAGAQIALVSDSLDALKDHDLNTTTPLHSDFSYLYKSGDRFLPISVADMNRRIAERKEIPSARQRLSVLSQQISTNQALLKREREMKRNGQAQNKEVIKQLINELQDLQTEEKEMSSQLNSLERKRLPEEAYLIGGIKISPLPNKIPHERFTNVNCTNAIDVGKGQEPILAIPSRFYSYQEYSEAELKGALSRGAEQICRSRGFANLIEFQVKEESSPALGPLYYPWVYRHRLKMSRRTLPFYAGFLAEAVRRDPEPFAITGLLLSSPITLPVLTALFLLRSNKISHDQAIRMTGADALQESASGKQKGKIVPDLVYSKIYCNGSIDVSDEHNANPAADNHAWDFLKPLPEGGVGSDNVVPTDAAIAR